MILVSHVFPLEPPTGKKMDDHELNRVHCIRLLPFRCPPIPYCTLDRSGRAGRTPT